MPNFASLVLQGWANFKIGLAPERTLSPISTDDKNGGLAGVRVYPERYAVKPCQACACCNVSACRKADRARMCAAAIRRHGQEWRPITAL